MSSWLDKLTEQRLVKEGVGLVSDTVGRTLDRNVKLAVTGLSRSGKTAFITSLIHQLLHASGSQKQLPFFHAVKDGRLHASQIVPQSRWHVPSFEYHEALKSITDTPPTWPASTRGISEIRIALKFRSNHPVKKKLLSNSRLYLDIIDYPGEWLLDLPLLDWSFEQWSEHQRELIELEPRKSLAHEWLSYFQSLSLAEPAKEEQLKKLAQLYTDFLWACKKDDAGLSLIQPGRFILPGELEGAPVLQFCPIAFSDVGLESYSKDSLYHTLKARYDYYKEHVVKSFYKEHFARFDRQVVLVDCLQALNQGYASYFDMRRALHIILESFNYGKSNLLHRLFSPRIDKLLFAATKVDHLPPEQHTQLQTFLQKMLTEARNSIHYKGIDTDVLALASLQAAQPVIARHQGEQLSCVKGLRLSDRTPAVIFPGEVPETILQQSDWTPERFNFVQFAVPDLADPTSEGLPHIRMDRAMQYLFGDKLQ